MIDLNQKLAKGQNFNFGWPISSYGEHYGGPDGRNKHRYKDFPLHKSHKDFGFVEPLAFFTPSVAISQIAKLNKNNFIVSNLKAKSIHTFKLDKNKKIIDIKEIKIGERIRDIVISEKNIYLYLEDTSSIAIISKVN